MSGIDLNRAGTPLLEIVSEPDMRSAEEAVAYAKALHALVRWIGICDGNMQEGSFRCDANVSVRPQGVGRRSARAARSRTSIRSASCKQAIDYEVRWQIESLEDGGTIDAGDRCCTIRTAAKRARCAPRRTRTTTAIFPTRTCCRWKSPRRGSSGCEPSLPELPQAKRERYMREFELSRLRCRRV